MSEKTTVCAGSSMGARPIGEFAQKMQLVAVNVSPASATCSEMADPVPEETALLKNVQLVTTALLGACWRKPPPFSPLLLKKTQLVIVSKPKKLRTPPPLPLALFESKTQLVRVCPP